MCVPHIATDVVDANKAGNEACLGFRNGHEDPGIYADLGSLCRLRLDPTSSVGGVSDLPSRHSYALPKSSVE